MLKLTIDEYSTYFKMSKEMIKSKIKEKRLDYLIEDGVTYIVATHYADDKKDNFPTKLDERPRRATVATVLSLYQKENQHLKDKIALLEEKIDKLIDDKEQMLRDELNKIEQVYSNKDEQLKNILELINAKLTMEQNPPLLNDMQNSKKEILDIENSDFVELKEYLKNLDLKPNQKKKIKKRFLASNNNDVRIIQQNGKLYLDFSKYDYSDLLAY